MKVDAPVDFTSEDQRYQYPLDANSVVFDCGGYHGRFTRGISERYGCRIVAFEPIFPEVFQQNTIGLPNVELVQAGVGAVKRTAVFGVAGDWTGEHCTSTDQRQIEILHLGEEIRTRAPQGVDLLKLNIEGMEYEVLEDLVGSGIIRDVRFLQVQFHAYDPAIERRTEHLIRSIQNTHKLSWGFNPFIWLSFERNPKFHTRSQAGQDVFAWHATGCKANGIFLDIGSSHAIDRNNTYTLEQMGWGGDLVDNSPGAAESASAHRKARFHFGDASQLDWNQVIQTNWVDYLSLDVDAWTLKTLESLPLDRVQFGCITIEHDSYRFGPEPRDNMRRILRDKGYDLIAADVKCDDLAFEDWWIHQKNLPHAERFKGNGKDWKEVVKSVL